MDLVEHLKYGIIKVFGTGKFMVLKNGIAKRQNGYLKLHKAEFDAVNKKMKAIPIPAEGKELDDDSKAKLNLYLAEITQIQIDQMEYVLTPEIIDTVCLLVEKIGQAVTVDTITVNDMTMESVISLGFQIIRMDDAASEEEAAEKKKIA